MKAYSYDDITIQYVTLFVYYVYITINTLAHSIYSLSTTQVLARYVIMFCVLCLFYVSFGVRVDVDVCIDVT